jgi:flagellar M-ring protein FliF
MAFFGDFKAWSPLRQITLVLASGSMLTALALALWFWVIRTPYSEAFSGLKSEDAATIIAELDRRKTPYRLAENGTSILVPEENVDATRINILGGDLPLKGAVGFELFNKSDMGLTEFAQKINYQRALQGELARTIMSIDAVESARVHLALPEEGIFEHDRRSAKASVALSMLPGASAGSGLVEAVQNLVASAVPDLSASSVAVLDSHGSLLSNVQIEPRSQSPEGQQRSSLEQYYASRLAFALRDGVETKEAQVNVLLLSSSAIAQVQGEAAFEPEKRQFPLSVSVQLPKPPDAALRSRITDIAHTSIGFDPARSDEISFLLAARSPMVTPAPSAPHPSIRGSGDITPAPAFAWLNYWIWPIVAGSVALLFASAWGLRGRRRSAGHRDGSEAFADKLRVLLDSREGIDVAE